MVKFRQESLFFSLLLIVSLSACRPSIDDNLPETTASTQPISSDAQIATNVDTASLSSSITSLSSAVTAQSSSITTLNTNLAAAQPTGAILPYSGTSAPTGFLMCDGAQVSRTTYSALYAVVGNAFGNGDGSTTFHLPDLRGRFLRGTDNMGTAQGAAGRDPDAASRSAMNAGGNSTAATAVGSVQSDAFRAHTHTYTYTNFTYFVAGGGFPAPDSNQYTATSGSTGGNETRPINAYANYIIKY